MAILSLAIAKAHLRLAPEASDEDADLQRKLDMAEALVLDYLDTDTATWTLETATRRSLAQAAILVTLGELYRFRGDDPSGGWGGAPRAAYGSLSPVVEGFLKRYRDPTLA